MGINVEPPGGFDLVGLDDLAARLGVAEFTDSVDRARAQGALDDALGLAQGYTRQTLAFVADDTVNIPQPDGYDRYLWLPELPVVDVSAVTLGAMPVTDWTTQTDGYLYRYYGWRQYSEFTYSTPPSVTVTYSHGFTTCPGDLKAALLAMAQAAWNNPQGFKQVKQGETWLTYELSEVPAGAIGASHMATLRRYRRMERSKRLHNPMMFR